MDRTLTVAVWKSRQRRFSFRPVPTRKAMGQQHLHTSTSSHLINTVSCVVCTSFRAHAALHLACAGRGCLHIDGRQSCLTDYLVQLGAYPESGQPRLVNRDLRWKDAFVLHDSIIYWLPERSKHCASFSSSFNLQKSLIAT